jgi:hypothetical protein
MRRSTLLPHQMANFYMLPTPAPGRLASRVIASKAPVVRSLRRRLRSPHHRRFSTAWNSCRSYVNPFVHGQCADIIRFQHRSRYWRAFRPSVIWEVVTCVLGHGDAHSYVFNARPHQWHTARSQQPEPSVPIRWHPSAVERTAILPVVAKQSPPLPIPG